jgi:hypothetical protein
LITVAATLSPATAWADVCEAVRPNWDGVPVGVFGELLWLAQSPLVLVLIVATALAVRFRSEKGGLIVVVGWSIATFLVTGWGGDDGTAAAAMAAGCIGPSWLFITVAAALCIGVVLYTAPLKRGNQTTGDDDDA